METTEVQINALCDRVVPTRCVAAAYQTVVHQEPLQNPTLVLRPADIENLAIYRDYVDYLRLVRLRWMPALDMEVGLSELSLSQPEQNSGFLEDSLLCVTDELVDQEDLVRWFTCSYLSARLPSRRRFRSNWSEESRSQGMESRSSTMMLCSYCGDVFLDADPTLLEDNEMWQALGAPAPPEATRGARWKSTPLCPRHRKKVLDLQLFKETEGGQDTVKRQSTVNLPCEVSAAFSGGVGSESVGRLHSFPQTPRGMSPVSARAWDGDTRKFDKLEVGEEMAAKWGPTWRHLWSYAFPHATPREPEVHEMGLPAWWIQTLESSTEASDLGPSKQSHVEKREKRSPRTPSTVQRPGRNYSHRSIFQGANLDRLIDEAMLETGMDGAESPCLMAKTCSAPVIL